MTMSDQLGIDVVAARERILRFPFTPLGGENLSHRIPRSDIEAAADEATQEGIAVREHTRLARAVAKAEDFNRSMWSLNARKARLMAMDRDYRTTRADEEGNPVPPTDDNQEDLPYPAAFMGKTLLGVFEDRFNPEEGEG